MTLRLITALLVLTAGFDSVSGADELHIFLKPGISVTGDALTLGDISAVEGNSSSAESAEALELTSALSSDGYIDRNELRLFLKDKTASIIFIYGSGVRIGSASAAKQAPVIKQDVKRGVKIKAVFERNQIRIEQQVTAVKHGRQGDVIPVRLKSGRIVPAKIIDSELVSIE